MKSRLNMSPRFSALNPNIHLSGRRFQALDSIEVLKEVHTMGGQ